MLLRIVALGISDDWIAGDAGLHGGDQSAALLQLLFAHTVGQETELPNADQAGREHMEQKAADELDRVQLQDGFSAVVGIILPIKMDVAVFERAQPVIGNGYTMGVAS